MIDKSLQQRGKMQAKLVDFPISLTQLLRYA